MKTATAKTSTLFNKHNLLKVAEPAVYGLLAIAFITPVFSLSGQHLDLTGAIMILTGILLGNLAVCGWRPVTALFSLREDKSIDDQFDHFIDLVVNNDEIVSYTPDLSESRRQAA